MLNTILVPLDGSDLSELALPVAAGLAAHGGKIVLVRAALAHTLPGVDPVDAQLRAIEEVEAYLGDVAGDLADRGYAVETAAPYGPAAESILDEIRIRKANLVVMGTHGRSGLGRMLYGSVAEGVLGQSEVPVMLIRAWEGRRHKSGIDLDRIVAPLDGSEFAEAALPAAVELALKLNAELVLTQAVVPPDEVRTAEDGRVIAYIDQDLGDLEAEARRYLCQIRKRLLARYPDLQIDLDVRVGAPVDGIVSASDDRGQAPVVMATHGRTGLSRLFLGSVAGATLREGNMPLLLVRPGALAPAALAFAEDLVGPAVSLELKPTELALVRSGLELLHEAMTRDPHLRPRIQKLLDRIPEPAGQPQPVGAAR